MNFIKTYFLPPTSDFFPAPPKGPLRLGSIISSVDTPRNILNEDVTVEIPSNEIQNILTTDWKKTISKRRKGALGVYAQFVGGAIGAGAELSGESDRAITNVFAFNSMSTISFEPKQRYLEQTLKAPDVQYFMRKDLLGRRKPVFLVTGLKTVTGANIKFSNDTSFDLHANLGLTVETTATAVGPKGRWVKSTQSSTEFIRNDEFVFAFRVLQINLNRKGDHVEARLYNEGAFLDTHDAQNAEDENIPETCEVIVSTTSAVLATDECDGAQVRCVPVAL